MTQTTLGDVIITNPVLHAYYKQMPRLALRLLFSGTPASKSNRTRLIKKSSYYMVQANRLVKYI